MYTSAHQLLPAFPGQHVLGPAIKRAEDLTARAAELGGHAHPVTRAALRELLRNMNSYYSNRIEGQSTTPRNIDAALHQKFSDQPEIARLQRIAVAHIDAEKALEASTVLGHPLNADSVLMAHRALYSRLEPIDRVTQDGAVIEPGQLRHADVVVGRHAPPSWDSLPAFMAEFSRHYDREYAWAMRLIAIACAHHRMAWIHPFMDGNGRAVRLQTHVAMLPITHGLWSVSRGFARDTAAYYSALAAADLPRQGDLDGRGNLTEKGLLAWLDYFIAVCEDQLAYMSTMLALDGMKLRIKTAVHSEVARRLLRPEVALPVYHLFAAGPLTRGEFIQMTGLADRTGRAALSEALKSGLVASDTSHAPVRFAFPVEMLPTLLPDLYG